MEDGLKAASLGVDALGFIFAPSPRRVGPDVAQKIIGALPTPPLKVGVFVNEDPDEVLRVVECCGLNGLQFHGEESPEYCKIFSLPVIKAIRVKGLESLNDMERYPDATLLLDTYSSVKAGGTGNPFSWEIALRAKEKRSFILSGGLNQANVGEAISKVRPWGVDISSGVEMVPGKKDHFRMNDFVKEVRKANEKTR